MFLGFPREKGKISLEPIPSGELGRIINYEGIEAETDEEEAIAYFKSGIYDLENNSYSDAVNSFQKSIKAFPSLSGYLNLGLSLICISDIKPAYDILKSGYQVAKRKRIKKIEAAFLGNLGIANMFLGKMDEAINMYEEARKIYQETKDRTGAANQLASIGLVYYYYSKYDTALDYVKDAYEVHKKEGLYNKETANDLGNMGLILLELKKRDEAMADFEKAKNIQEVIGDRIGIARSYGNIGLIFREDRDFDNGIKYFNRALTEYEKLGNKIGMANQLGNIGNLYYDSAFNKDEPDKLEVPKKLEEALKYYNIALNKFIDTGYKMGIAAAYRNLGKTTDWLGRYQEAFEYYQKSYDLYEQIGNYSQLATLLNDKGIVLVFLARHDEAAKAFDKAIELKPEYARAWYNRACIFSIRGDKENALRSLAKAIELDPALKADARNDADFKKYLNDPNFKKVTL